MTTNQKVVGSNPAGLTKEKAPEAKKIKASGAFSISYDLMNNTHKYVTILFYYRATTE